MIESEITAWLLRAESSLLAHMPAGNFSWDDAEAPLSPAVVASTAIMASTPSPSMPP